MSDKLPSSPRRMLALRIAVGVVAVPAIMVGFAGAASAAEITPVAEYLDSTVADLSQDIVDVVTTLLT